MELCGRQKVVQRKMRRWCLRQDVSFECVYKRVSSSINGFTYRRIEHLLTMMIVSFSFPGHQPSVNLYNSDSEPTVFGERVPLLQSR
ncbi:hypothetical protein GB937_008677 [Aspergillus fischeri]|nr:hypothetical protein GB937_008677 [Aspergillus fischeri]